MTIPLAQSAGLRWLTLGSSLAIVCGLMLPVALLDLRDAQRPQEWSQTQGIVESSGVSTTSSSSGRLGVDLFYVPDVIYRYRVAGREFRGSTVYLGKGPSSEAAARATAARYPVGARVNVFYDSKDPARAVLDQNVQAKDYQAVVGTAIGLLIAIASLLRFRRLRRIELGEVASPKRARSKSSRGPSRRRHRKP